MEKLYNDKKYSQMAEIANQQGEFLYQYVHTILSEVEFPDSHKRYVEQEIAELLIAPENYYICYNDNFTDGTINENYEAELQEKEKQRISNLKCTKRVFVLMLEKLGINYFSDIKPVIEADPKIQLEWELCVELLRSNQLLDTVAEKFNITSKQLDDLFRYANGEISWEEDR